MALCGQRSDALEGSASERLRELVDLNFDRLQLIPREAGQAVGLGHIDYPKPPAPPEPDPEAVPGSDAAPQE